jgi:hypothetical protein
MDTHNDDKKISFRPYAWYKTLLIIIVLADILVLLGSAYILGLYQKVFILIFTFSFIVLSLLAAIKLFQYYPLHVEITKKNIVMKNLRTKEVYSSLLNNFQAVSILYDYQHTAFILFSKEVMDYEKQKQVISKIFTHTNLRLSLNDHICIAVSPWKCKEIIEMIQNEVPVFDQRNAPRIWRW